MTLISYDPMGRLNWQASWIPTIPNHTGVITSATYDLAGNMTSLTYPDGRVVAQAYNQGQLASVSYSSWNGQTVNSAYVAGASYGPPGNVTAETLGNGVQMLAGYNSRLNADGMLTGSNGAQYVYDALDQRVEKTSGSASTEYIYFQGSVLA
ncbi:MAG: hypothetical protein ACYCOX_09640, partial [Acidobacteriaceae bacterium]